MDKPLERDVLRACLDYLKLRGVFHFRVNNAGIFNQKSGGYFHHGMLGISDIIAVLPQIIEIHGEKVTQGVICCIEVKSPTGKTSTHQDAFLGQINRLGGLGVVVRSVDDLKKALDECA